MIRGRRELRVWRVLGSGGRRNGEDLRGGCYVNSRGVRESVLCCCVTF